MPFALAQVIRELGDEAAADICYEEGVAKADAIWLRQFPIFAFVSLILAFIFWFLTMPLWLILLAAIVGPTTWVYIKRNRKQLLPGIGFSKRAETSANVNMREILRG